jgi:hypothetical protein
MKLMFGARHGRARPHAADVHQGAVYGEIALVLEDACDVDVAVEAIAAQHLEAERVVRREPGALK